MSLQGEVKVHKNQCWVIKHFENTYTSQRWRGSRKSEKMNSKPWNSATRQTSKPAKIQLFQFSSAAQSCLTLCDPVDCSMPGFPVHHQLPGPIHVHWVSDAIQPAHPLSSSSPPTFNLPHHQRLFQWVSSLHQVAKVLEFKLQHQFFQWIFRTDFL